MDTIRTELERVYQLVTSEAELQARASLAEARLELEQREAALAAAMELLTVDPAVQAAFHDGRMEERHRVLWLIEQQRDMLSRAGQGHAILGALKRAVEGA